MTITLPYSIPLSKETPHDHDFIGNLETIQKELTEKEIHKIDMRLLGDILFGQAKALSSRVDYELLKPISVWLNDSGWIKQFQGLDNERPDWAKYKRRSRQWNKQQRDLAGERLKQYWQAIWKKKNFRREISQLIGKPCPGQNSSFRVPDDFLLPIIKPFSRSEQSRMKLEKEFLKAIDVSLSYILPWRVILTADINTEKNFSDLKTYLPNDKKMDKICKLMNLLQLENDGVILLNQKEPFEDFEIQPKSTAPTQISIKDRQGNEWDQDWFHLCNEEKNKMIEKIKSRQIICKQV